MFISRNGIAHMAGVFCAAALLAATTGSLGAEAVTTARNDALVSSAVEPHPSNTQITPSAGSGGGHIPNTPNTPTPTTTNIPGGGGAGIPNTNTHHILG